MAITPKELAAHWGVSRAFAYKSAKAGCPLESLEKADSWRRHNSQRGVGTRSKKKSDSRRPEAAAEAVSRLHPSPVTCAAPPKAVEPAFSVVSRQAIPAPVAPPELVSDDLPLAVDPVHCAKLSSLQDALRASVQVQSEAYRLVMEATAAGSAAEEWLGIRISAFNKATEGRMKAETSVQEFEVAANRLLTFEDATALLSRAWMPLVSRLLTLGKRNASKANPHDPVLAESVINQAVRAALKEAQCESFPMPQEAPEVAPAA